MYTRVSLALLMFLAVLPQLSWADQQVVIPDRPTTPVFAGQAGETHASEVDFDPRTRTVTMKVSVHDPNGYFVPRLRRQNFAVFEDGAKQRNVTVEIEHAPITVAVLVELGGRSQQWNARLASDAEYLIRPLLDVLGRGDSLAVFAYADTLQTIIDFDTPHEKWDDALDALRTPNFSEANLYDAAIAVLDKLAAKNGRKALLLISTGIDTFSQATFDTVLKKAEEAATPVYAISLGRLAQHTVMSSERGPLARVNWTQVRSQLERLARVSGGRAYTEASSVEMPAIYDDIMEALRIRYVITYVSSTSTRSGEPRKVEVRLVNAADGAPLQVVDASGRRVTARVIFTGSYTPAGS